MTAIWVLLGGVIAGIAVCGMVAALRRGRPDHTPGRASSEGPGEAAAETPEEHAARHLWAVNPPLAAEFERGLERRRDLETRPRPSRTPQPPRTPPP